MVPMQDFLPMEGSFFADTKVREDAVKDGEAR